MAFWNSEKKKSAASETRTLPKPTEVPTYTKDEYLTVLSDLQERVKGTKDIYFVTLKNDKGAIDASVRVEDPKMHPNGY